MLNLKNKSHRIWNKNLNSMTFLDENELNNDPSLIQMKTTNIVDIKGKMIYDKDVVLCWNDDGFLENFNRTFKFIIDLKEKSTKWLEYEYYEVIGNIYEHPELLNFQLTQYR